MLVLTGCGPVVVMPRQQEVAAQAASDLDAAADYVLTDEQIPYPTKLAVFDMREHARNMGRALEIAPDELPKPRVTTDDWRKDPNAAHTESSANHNVDSSTIADYGWKAVGGVGIALLLARAGQLALGNSPAGPILAFINHLMGGENPKRRKVHNKMLKALDEYKALDPDWKNNKLYVLLSDKFTTTEKDLIKNDRHDL